MQYKSLFKGRLSAFAFFGKPVPGNSAQAILDALVQNRLNDVGNDIELSWHLDTRRVTRLLRVEQSFWTADIVVKGFHGSLAVSATSARKSFEKELRNRIPPTQSFEVNGTSVRLFLRTRAFKQLKYRTAIGTCGEQAMRLSSKRKGVSNG